MYNTRQGRVGVKRGFGSDLEKIGKEEVGMIKWI